MEKLKIGETKIYIYPNKDKCYTSQERNNGKFEQTFSYYSDKKVAAYYIGTEKKEGVLYDLYLGDCIDRSTFYIHGISGYQNYEEELNNVCNILEGCKTSDGRDVQYARSITVEDVNSLFEVVPDLKRGIVYQRGVENRDILKDFRWGDFGKKFNIDTTFPRKYNSIIRKFVKKDYVQVNSYSYCEKDIFGPEKLKKLIFLDEKYYLASCGMIVTVAQDVVLNVFYVDKGYVRTFNLSSVSPRDWVRGDCSAYVRPIIALKSENKKIEDEIEKETMNQKQDEELETDTLEINIPKVTIYIEEDKIYESPEEKNGSDDQLFDSARLPMKMDAYYIGQENNQGILYDLYLVNREGIGGFSFSIGGIKCYDNYIEELNNISKILEGNKTSDERTIEYARSVTVDDINSLLEVSVDDSLGVVRQKRRWISDMMKNYNKEYEVEKFPDECKSEIKNIKEKKLKNNFYSYRENSLDISKDLKNLIFWNDDFSYFLASRFAEVSYDAYNENKFQLFLGLGLVNKGKVYSFPCYYFNNRGISYGRTYEYTYVRPIIALKSKTKTRRLEERGIDKTKAKKLEERGIDKTEKNVYSKKRQTNLSAKRIEGKSSNFPRKLRLVSYLVVELIILIVMPILENPPFLDYLYMMIAIVFSYDLFFSGTKKN